MVVMGMLVLVGLVGAPIAAWQLTHQDNEVARGLHDDGRTVTASGCERHVVEREETANNQGKPNGGRRAVKHEVDAVRVRLPGQSQSVELATIDESRDYVDNDVPVGWQRVPVGADYACPLQVVVDADHPTVAMDKRDVDYFGTDDSRNFQIGLLVGMLVLVIGPGWVLVHAYRSIPQKPNDEESS